MPVLAANVVATSQPLAAQAGLRMLLAGGNAVDAAVAAAIALTVVEPTSNGIGADLFAIVWDGRTLRGLNASGRSPAGWTRQAFSQFTEMPARGWHAVTVPEDLIERVAAGRKLRTIRLPENDRAGRTQPPHDESIFGGNVVLVDRRSERRPQTGDGRDVLDADRQAAQRTRILTARQSRVERGGVLERARVRRDDRIEHRVQAIDAIETGADDVGRRQFAPVDAARELARRQVWQLAHGFQESPRNATARQNAASPPRNFHGKQPRIRRVF